jgi:hypothetical protein
MYLEFLWKNLIKVNDRTGMQKFKAVANEKFCDSIADSSHSTDSETVPQTGIQTHQLSKNTSETLLIFKMYA